MRIGLLLLISVFFLTACTPGQPVRVSPPENLPSTITPSNPPEINISTPSSTPTPEASATLAAPSKTSTSTIVAKNTPTPRPTHTRTPVPTFTPAILSLTPDTAYTLRDWTPEQADLLVDRISSYLTAIENEPVYASVYGYSNYMEQYQYLALVESEALLRFPNAQQADRWQWDLCYNLAFSYLSVSTDAPELQCYSRLIENGLNTGQTNILQLSNWFREHEFRFPFAMTSITPPSGYNTSYILVLEDNAVFWLLEKDGVYRLTGLMSSMFYLRESGMDFQTIDLTGDAYPELVLNSGISYCCGAFTEQYIYDLSTGSPRQLSFLNHTGARFFLDSEYDSDITQLKDSLKPGLLFKSNFGNPTDQPCKLKKYETYFWNGDEFELAETWFGIDPPDEYDDKDLCQFALDTASNPAELDVVVQAIQQRNIPPFETYREVILFRLGEYYARTGDRIKAADYFSRLAAEPVDPQSEWKMAAQVFLENDQTTDSFYKLCAKIAPCDIQKTFEQVIEDISPELFPLVNEYLKENGVSIKSSGFFDFDGDQFFEQWLVVQHPTTQQLEFWILVKGSTKIYALFLTQTTDNKPKILNYSTSTQKHIFELSAQKIKTLYSLEKSGISGQPYILSAQEHPDDPNANRYDPKAFWAHTMDDLTTNVMKGGDLALDNQILLDLENSKDYGCKTYWCGQLYYLSGLINELMGNTQAAVDAYLKLWKNYPDSPYTIMVRSKLITTP